MIECIFTLDYEIYGNGEGSLREHVYEPAEALRRLFVRHGVRFVPFVEAAELEIIETHAADPASALVQAQLRMFHDEGFALGLHLHPQWYNGRRENGRWVLDDSEYNLCTLTRERIRHIVERALRYLRAAVGDPAFTPSAFRAGNWLFQPTRVAAEVLVECGVRMDSSVFKGGVRHEHGLDYRRAARNAYFWRFGADADRADPSGAMIELPIHTRMVPFWKMGSAKRVAMERHQIRRRALGRSGFYRLLDLSRVWHPLKFDFCRMTLAELQEMLGAGLDEDRRDPATLRPLVAIGHTKELTDLATIDALLAWLPGQGIKVSTFDQVYDRCVALLKSRPDNDLRSTSLGRRGSSARARQASTCRLTH